ncbi:AMP-binding protein [candidate division CSSED10-310 bacterium]|uniref:AMP-binding protein n=1 Tax=candidate division CSSED10-310 bacterium TaxID=2855610 RepID=A0ABV6YU70_UNCC1
MLVGTVLQEKAQRHHDNPALISKEGTYSYGDLHRLAKCVANSLLNRGLKKGDRVGLLTRKTAETMIAYLGMGLAGIVGVPISFHFRKNRLQQILDLTKPSLVLIDRAFLHLIKEMGEYATSLEFIVIGDQESHSYPTWNELLADSGDHAPAVTLHKDDVFYLNFTSGSTGRPKAICTTHAHIHWNTSSCIEALAIPAAARHLCTFAVFSHPHEIFARPLWTGGAMVLIDSLYPKSIATMITDYQVSCVMGLAPMYEMLIPFAKSERFDFSHLQLVESGGMTTEENLQERFLENFQIPIRAVWGSTETNGVALAVPPSTGITRSCGKTTPYYNVRIIDAAGKEVDQGETGEMIIQGPAVVQQYYNDPAETEKWFRDDWFFTGDMVYQDSDEFFYFRGRKSGMMKVGGLKVFPQEIEDVIRTLPAVDEVVIVPSFEKLRGEVPRAVVTMIQGEQISEQQIKDHCRDTLSNYMIPKKIDFRQSLPKTPAGKIDRAAIMAETAAGYTPPEVEEFGHRIHKIDLKLLQLLNERTRVSIQMRKLQPVSGQALFLPGQEEETIKKILGHNSGPLHDEFVEQLFRDLLQYLMRL